MPFGMKNSQATFMRLMSKCLAGLEGVYAYIDDMVIYHNTWENHIETQRKPNCQLSEERVWGCNCEISWTHGGLWTRETEWNEDPGYTEVPHPKEPKGVTTISWDGRLL